MLHDRNDAALERHAAGQARVVPIILRPCDWKSTPLGKLVAAPRDGKAIATWANHDEAYTDVAMQVRALVGQMPTNATSLRHNAQRGPDALAQLAAQVVPAGPRSSNLRLRKEFSQLDQDQFLHESFEYMARYFENSAAELKARNAGIDTQFRRIDADTFTAAIYQNGARRTQCAISLGNAGFRSNAISYSADASGRSGSFNEQVSVAYDDQAMYLKPLGMAMFGSAPEQLSQEGAADFFWSILMQRLQ